MRALVLGGAVSGKAAVGLLERLDAEVFVYDSRAAAVEPFARSGLRVASGAWSPDLLTGIDVVVASPGFAPSTAAIRDADAAGIPVWNEVELALQQMSSPIVAVTGTNGKTTVVELVTAMLNASGLAATAAGNIGQAVSSIADQDWDVVVLEISSFQLARTESLRPKVAVVVNVAPDHLDWHGSIEHYRSSKARIFQHVGGDDIVVYDADDGGASSLVERAPGVLVPVSGSRIPVGGYGIDDSAMVLPSGRIDLDALGVSDVSYRMDLVAAAVAADRMGASAEAIESVATGFRPSQHRRSVVGTWNNITWINDSKATNPHGAVAAIAAYPSVVLIAGGRNKGLNLSPIAQADNVRFLIAIGESASELLAAAGSRPARRAESLLDAISIATDIAAPGDTVLLSPGCASFDMFSSYGERGDEFTRLVHEAKEGAR